MTLQRRLVAVMSILLVAGLLVADIVTYVSVRSFLYGRADETLASSEALAFNYVAFAQPSAVVYASPGNGAQAQALPGVFGSTPALAPVGTAGKITSTFTPSRQIQFALKFIF